MKGGDIYIYIASLNAIQDNTLDDIRAIQIHQYYFHSGSSNPKLSKFNFKKLNQEINSGLTPAKRNQWLIHYYIHQFPVSLPFSINDQKERPM